MESLFYLKKFITFFIEPLGLVLLAGAAGAYFLWKGQYGRGRLLSGLSLLLLLLFSYPPVSNFLLMNLEDAYPMHETVQKNIEYIHVLGSGHNDDMTQPLSSRVGDDSIKRVVEGILLQKRYPGSVLIFTGYEGPTAVANAEVNSDLAQALGAEDMIINPLPRDTKEEALFAKTLVGKKPFILVTSATHMPRAMRVFEGVGMHPVAAPTAFKKRDASLFSAPAAAAFEDSRVAIHEYIGMVWASLLH